MNNASGSLLNAVMVAQAINPDLYEGLDIKKVHQEYIDILGFDFDVSKAGVFYKN